MSATLLNGNKANVKGTVGGYTQSMTIKHNDAVRTYLAILGGYMITMSVSGAAPRNLSVIYGNTSLGIVPNGTSGTFTIGTSTYTISKTTTEITIERSGGAVNMGAIAIT